MVCYISDITKNNYITSRYNSTPNKVAKPEVLYKLFLFDEAKLLEYDIELAMCILDKAIGDQVGKTSFNTMP